MLAQEKKPDFSFDFFVLHPLDKSKSQIYLVRQIGMPWPSKCLELRE